MVTTSGIYEIVNTTNGKRYIGSAINLQRRWWGHQSTLRLGQHHSPHLQHAWVKRGKAAFEFRVLGLCAPEHLTFFEQAWMDARKPEYNISPTAGSSLGVKHTPEARANMSAALTGKTRGPRSVEVRTKISAALKGKLRGPHSAEHRAKISTANKGTPPADTTRVAVSASNRRRRGRPISRSSKRYVGVGLTYKW